MAPLTYTAKNIRPLDGSTVRQCVAGVALSLGDAVALTSAGTVSKTTGSTGDFYGIVTSTQGKTVGADAGQEVGVIVFGPATGFEDLTPSALAYLGDAGELDSAGTVAVAYAENETTLFIMPGLSTVGS